MTAVIRAERIFDEAVSTYNSALKAWAREGPYRGRLEALEEDPNR
jgi:hypothetical protein